MTCIDNRDGTIKWKHSVGGKIQSTPAIKDNLVVFGLDNGNLHVLNKYTDSEEFTYNLGTILFNSPINSSSVINGNSLMFGEDSGNVDSLNIDRHEVRDQLKCIFPFLF